MVVQHLKVLCYERIMNDIVPSTNDKDSYFLNFSDGIFRCLVITKLIIMVIRPLNHTKKWLRKFVIVESKYCLILLVIQIGIEIETQSHFKTMYGKDSEYIDITSVMSVSKTMNKKFLQK